MISIDGEQIIRAFFQQLFVLREIRKLRKSRDFPRPLFLIVSYSSLYKGQVLILRLRLSVGQVKFMRVDILDHSYTPYSLT